jgi:hypothetical protein
VKSLPKYRLPTCNSDNVEFVLDKDAASDLTRFDTPWLVKDCVWDKQLKKESRDLAIKTL